MPQILQSEQKTVSATAHSLKKPRLPINSFGFRFFAMIMGGALISIASIAFLFAETIKFQAEEQIQQLLESKVGTINEVTDRAENLAYSLGVSVATLHVRGAETPETYQVLTQKLFESHPSYVLGMGFGQKENGILPERQWFYPYYQIESAAASLAQRSPTDAPQTTAEAEVIDYINRADEPYFYPTSESYRQYFLPQKSLWRSPYQRENDTLITFYSQIFGNQDEWLGTSVIDVDAAYLQAILNEPVFRQGGQLMLLDLNGQVIANPVNEDVATDQTYQDIPGLNEIWSQIEGENSSGLIEGETGYWSYIQIPEQSWVVLAYVPYGTVFGRILAITLGATLLAGLLMAGLTTLAIRYLNKRLRPVINECQRLSTEDETVTQRLIGKDELEQLSISFFNLLEQLQLSQTQVKLEAAHASEVETQLSQIKDRTVANQRRQRQVTRKLANILPPESNASIATASSTPVYLSTQQIQQELSQLNQVVSTLAEDDWLLETLEARNSDPSAQNTTELTQVNSRLSHTFLQILAALHQFSQLLAAFSQTQGHVLAIEQTMLLAKQEMQTQTETVNRLKNWLESHEMLSQEIAESTANTALTSALPPALRGEIESTAQAFRQTSQTLNQQLRSLSNTTESLDQKQRQYQRISSAAQVLIMNASTLSISASRQQSPEDFEQIVEQFRHKNTELQNLAQQLENTQSQQQQSSTQANTLVHSLQTNVATFEQAASQLDTLITALNSNNAHRKDNTATVQRTNQQLSRQLATLRQSLQQIETAVETTTGRIDTTLQVTNTINQISTDLPILLPPAVSR